MAEAHAGVEFIRTLDPHPGRLYNREQTRLIEPDVVFVKRGGEWVVSMNEEDLPSLRLSRGTAACWLRKTPTKRSRIT